MENGEWRMENGGLPRARLGFLSFPRIDHRPSTKLSLSLPRLIPISDSPIESIQSPHQFGEYVGLNPPHAGAPGTCSGGAAMACSLWTTAVHAEFHTRKVDARPVDLHDG